MIRLIFMNSISRRCPHQPHTPQDNERMLKNTAKSYAEHVQNEKDDQSAKVAAYALLELGAKTILKISKELGGETSELAKPEKKVIRNKIVEEVMAASKELKPVFYQKTFVDKIESKAIQTSDKGEDRADFTEIAKELRSFSESFFRTESDLNCFIKHMPEKQIVPKNAETFFNLASEAHAAAKSIPSAETIYASSEAIPTTEQLIDWINKEKAPLICAYSAHSIIGKRRSMQDDHFYHETERFAIAAVFDGHGRHGETFSTRAKNLTQAVLPNVIEENAEKLSLALFEAFIKELDSQILASFYGYGGSTAVITIIDKENSVAITLTLGDSESDLYRENEDNTTFVCHPLAVQRHWKSKTDWKRLQESWKMNGLNLHYPSDWHQNCRAEMIRTKGNRGLNISRTLGDREYKAPLPSGVTTISNKIKVTIQEVKKDDILIVSCDGLKNSVDKYEVIQAVKKWQDAPNLAEELMKEFYKEEQPSDNVTIVAIKVKTKVGAVNR